MEYKSLPDLNGWAALRAVVEKGGVMAAADALHVGQPAVTKRLRALEQCYKQPLTERVGGRIRLTEAGEKVYMLAVQTLDRHLALRMQIEEMARGETSMRLEVTFAIGEHFLPDLLIRFSERHPKFKVDSRLGYTREINHHLASGLTDLALLESAPDHPDVLVQKWMEDELWLVCSPRHPLAAVGVVSPDQLADFSYVIRERGSSPRDALDDALRRIGITNLNVALEVGSTDMIVGILARGLHVSFLPRFAVEDKVKAGILHHIETSRLRIDRTLWIARHRNALNHPVVEAFIAMMRER